MSLNVSLDMTKTEYRGILKSLECGSKKVLVSAGVNSAIKNVNVCFDTCGDMSLCFHVGNNSFIGDNVTIVAGGTCLNKGTQIVVMNDCLIGSNSTLEAGIIVGNGAIVKPGAVVLFSVPDFAIVAGNPAKVIGYRYTEEQQTSLNLIRWWNWDSDKVAANKELLDVDVDAFIKKYVKEATNELLAIEPAMINPVEKSFEGEEKILLYVPDFDAEISTCSKVIDSFVKIFERTNHELCIYVRDDEKAEAVFENLNSIFAKYEDAECYVNIVQGCYEDERSLLGQVDGYIVGNNANSVSLVDMAKLFNIPVYFGMEEAKYAEDTFKEEKKENANTYFSPKASSDAQVDKLNKKVEALIDNSKKVASLYSSLNDQINQCVDAINRHSEVISQISTNQVAMNSTFENYAYELYAQMDKIKYPIVKNEYEAIEKILKHNVSVCRFGDGEFEIIRGIQRQKFQRADDKLAVRLREVLDSKRDDVMICIADNYGALEQYNYEAKYNIRAYMTAEVRASQYEILDMNRVYYDTYFTRPYVSYVDNNTDAPKKRFEHLKKIWEGKDLLIIEGEKTRMGIGNDLLDNAKSVVRILGPAVSAFDKYDEILETAKKYAKDRLVLIAMGMTATVLAYDLAVAGFRAIDIGHTDLEYEWMKAGKGKRVPVKGKYNNELKGGDIVEEVKNPIYESQVVARII